MRSDLRPHYPRPEYCGLAHDEVTQELLLEKTVGTQTESAAKPRRTRSNDRLDYRGRSASVNNKANLGRKKSPEIRGFLLGLKPDQKDIEY
jgi:hypothetical protein